MFIITSKENNQVMGFGNTIERPHETTVRLTDERLVFVYSEVNVLSSELIPDDLSTSVYTYVNNVFTKIVEPQSDPDNTYGVPDETYHAIIDDYTIELLGGEL